MGKALRNNIRFAERAFAAGRTSFKVMPEPGSADVAELADPESFLREAILLRETERSFVQLYGPAEQETLMTDRTREILAGRRQPDRRPVVERSAREHKRRLRTARQDTGEMVALTEGVPVKPAGRAPSVAA